MENSKFEIQSKISVVVVDCRGEGKHMRLFDIKGASLLFPSRFLVFLFPISYFVSESFQEKGERLYKESLTECMRKKASEEERKARGKRKSGGES